MRGCDTRNGVPHGRTPGDFLVWKRDRKRDRWRLVAQGDFAFCLDAYTKVEGGMKRGALRLDARDGARVLLTER